MAEKKIQLWDSRIESMKRARTTPLDVHENDPLQAKIGLREARKNVRLLWISDIMLQKRPMLTQFNWDLYQPVTKALKEEWKIQTSQEQYGPDGTVRAGMDANLYWAPEELCQQQDLIMRGMSPKEVAQLNSEQMDEAIRGAVDSKGVGAEPIGEMLVTHDWREVEEAKEKAREGMNLGSGKK